MKTITIRDVAAAADVSIATVSRALSGHPRVNAETRQRVYDAVKLLGYVRNPNAANLKQRRTAFVATILRGRHNSFLMAIIEQLQLQARDHGLQLLIEIIDEKADEFEALRSLRLQRKLMAAIFLGSALTNREEQPSFFEFPLVFSTVNTSFIPCEHVASVSVDDFAAGEEAVRRLRALGHENIALLGYFSNLSDSTGLRLHGAVNAMRDSGGPYDPRLFRNCAFTFKSAYDATASLLKQGLPFSAIFAISDTMAMGAGRCLIDHGLRVPEDVSVIGFDGIDLGRYTHPSLATIRQPVTDIVQETLTLLSEMIKGEPGRHITVPYEFVVGESLAKAPTKTSPA